MKGERGFMLDAGLKLGGNMVRWKYAGLAALAVAALAIDGMAIAKDHTPAATGPALVSAPTASTKAAPVVAFIGDSYTAGAGSTGNGWAGRLSFAAGWDAVNLGLGGTGYVNSSGMTGCGKDFCPNYVDVEPEAVKAKPDIVVVSGGRNDQFAPPAQVKQNTSDLFARLHRDLPAAKIIALSPVWDATQPPPELATIADDVRAAVTTAGGTYVDIGEPLGGHPEMLAADKVHPNDQGHQALADATRAALQAAQIL